MTDKEKLHFFALNIHDFISKQKLIISDELVICEKKKDKFTENGRFVDLLLEQNEMSILNGKANFMYDLLKHLNSIMAELEIKE